MITPSPKYLILFCICLKLIHGQTADEYPDIIRTVPKFTEDTLNKANKILLFDNTSLNTGLGVVLHAQAVTYAAGLPIVYELIDKRKNFAIDPSTGVVRLVNPINSLKEYSFKIVAKDSAFKDQQRTYLPVNVQILSSDFHPPMFDHEPFYYVSIPEITPVGSLIHDQIMVLDRNYGHRGLLDVYCDPQESAASSCQFFKVESKPVRTGEHRIYIRLIASLKSQFKKKFVLPITAQISGLKSSTQLVITVNNRQQKVPKFSRKQYLLVVDTDSPNTNYLEIEVNNVDIENVSNTSFSLFDPHHNFGLSEKPPRCDDTQTCRQSIHLKSRPNKHNQYTMTVDFKGVNMEQSISAPIYVVIRPSKEIREAPKFVNTPSEFFLIKNLNQIDLSRNASVFVNEDEAASLFNSGFHLDLLNPDMTPLSDDLFEVVPNYGLGFLTSTIRIKNQQQAVHQKYDLILRATSRSNRNLATLKNITIYLLDHNEHTPYFAQTSYSVIINIDDGSFRLENELIQLQAFDDDPFENITYAIIGENRRKFSIDSAGRVFLDKYFDFASDENDFMYNVTVMAVDKAGHTNFTNLVLNLNVTLAVSLKTSVFECAMSGGQRSEINPYDGRSLSPPLIISVNSARSLRFMIEEANPWLNELEIDEGTGEVKLKSQLDNTLSQVFSRIEIQVRVYQVRIYQNQLLYSSSIKCWATIYLNDGPNSQNSGPHFLRTQYSANIYEEFLSKIIPVLKVEAVLTNSSIHSPLVYSLVNERERFIIDSAQGFVYPRYDLSLDSGVYSINIEAIETISGLKSNTVVYLFVLRKSKSSSIECSQDYMILKVDSENYFLNETVNLSQLGCSSTSQLKREETGEVGFQYEVFSSSTTYGCDGREITEYTPNLSVDSATGRLVSFEKLSRRNFCDATFLIMIHKDDVSVLVPLKLVITSASSEKRPKFQGGSKSTVILKSNFIHVGSYVTTIVAYDPVTGSLIDDYSIVSQLATPSSEIDYFTIEKHSGIVSLIEFPYIASAELTVMAKSESGLTSTHKIFIDLSSFFSNYGSNLIITNRTPVKSLALHGTSIKVDPILKNEISCATGVEKEVVKLTACQTLDYSLNYIPSSENASNYMIDKKAGHVFMRSYGLREEEAVDDSSNQVVILTAERKASSPSRFVDVVQKSLTITHDPSPDKIMPKFSQPSYDIPVLNTIPIRSTILALKYSTISDPLEIEFFMDELSNNEIESYFYLDNQPEHNTLYLKTKISPLRIDKPEVNLMISWRFGASVAKSRYLMVDDVENPKTFTRVSIKVIDSNGRSMSKLPSFKNPAIAHQLLTVNLTDNEHSLTNSSIFELQANSPIGSVISYRIVNGNSSPFHINNNLIELSKDALYSKFLRNSYLLFVQAFDLFYPSLYSTFTSIDVRINREIKLFPYFKRDIFSGPLNLVINGNYSLNVPIYDLKSLVYAPPGCGNLFFYVFNIADNSISDLFYVDSASFTIRLRKILTYQNVHPIFSIFVYVTNYPYPMVVFPKPTLNNTQLLFINLIFNDLLNTKHFFFANYSNNIVIDDIVPINLLIGFARTNFNKGVVYKIEECDLVVNMALLKDSNLCSLFRIDPHTGLIFTNNSNYKPFKNNFFTLEITATVPRSISGLFIKTSVILNIYVANRQETGRIIFKNFPTVLRTKTLYDLKRSVNQALNIKYPGVYEFSFSLFSMPLLPHNDTSLDVCFHVLNKNQNTILNFEQSKSILLDLFNIRVVLELFSIQKIERCSNRLDVEIFKDRYDHEGNWRLSSAAIGLIVLVGILIVFTILTIIVLFCCWLANMRQALIAPTYDSDNLDTHSNNFLLD